MLFSMIGREGGRRQGKGEEEKRERVEGGKKGDQERERDKDRKKRGGGEGKDIKGSRLLRPLASLIPNGMAEAEAAQETTRSTLLWKRDVTGESEAWVLDFLT